jgi:hypothetical protein
MTEHLEQRTDEWLQARVGKVTASQMKHVLAKTQKGLPTAARTT